MKTEEIAEVCHELNRAYCQALGDFSQQEWSVAPEWQRQSAILGVEFHLGNPDSKPSDSHESWMRQKEQDGWKFGPVKSPDLKEHPCMVPFEELSTEQQAKDYIFHAAVKNLQKYHAGT